MAGMIGNILYLSGFHTGSTDIAKRVPRTDMGMMEPIIAINTWMNWLEKSTQEFFSCRTLAML
jgi:hypothetical protein